MRNLIKMCSVVALAIFCAMPVHAAETKVNKMTTTDSGLRYVDVVVGKGASPTRGRQVKVHYTGTLENGTRFDSSVDRSSRSASSSASGSHQRAGMKG
jgi:FKBP-type peptidyl-prolyl cis-trans isomerases 1